MSSERRAAGNEPLAVLYEDEALIFINKPPGMVVQRGYDQEEPVLVEELEKIKGKLYPLQRLDRGTSGVLFFSRRSEVNPNLTRQFEQKRIRKTYLALCEGELAERQTIDAPLLRIGPISFGVREGGKRAVTHVEPLAATPGGSLLRIVLETGRMHQIRVHLAAIGHPLAGDWLYGQRNAARPMLHAAELAMTHPLTNQPLRVGAPLPEDFLEEAERRGVGVRNGGRTDPL
ncbi:MAG TPA: RluA family pseudouridine synthase [Thermoanaerobaculia bacterium]|nr:RluA family pseudouridine synthase [Thermoanaerobaculia bacterium]